MDKLLEIRDWVKSHKSYALLGLFGLLLGVVIFFFVSTNQSPPSTIEANKLLTSASVSSDKESKSKSSADSTGVIIVDVKGAVNKPDIYKVSADLRVADVIRLAGGFTGQADQKTVNLAGKLKDEEVVYVATIGENAAPVTSGASADSPSSGSTTTSGAGSKVNINTADAAALQTLSGIGAKKAQDIIDYRTQNGPFKTVEDLGKVSGFGEKTLAKLKDSITVD